MLVAKRHKRRAFRQPVPPYQLRRLPTPLPPNVRTVQRDAPLPLQRTAAPVMPRAEAAPHSVPGKVISQHTHSPLGKAKSR